MKSYFFKYTFIIAIITLLLFSFKTIAQELNADNYKLRFSFNTVKNFDDSRLLKVNFIGVNKKNRKDKIPIFNAEIKFYNVLDEEERLLGTTKTSNEGIAEITLPDTHEYIVDEFGNIKFIARFEGTDALRSKDSEIVVKNLFLDLNLTEIDSINTVVVKAFTLDSLGMELPIQKSEIYISVQGMFSKMILAEDYIADGYFEYEFPNDLPGDINGDITVYAIIEDHDEFGDVIQKKTINWGKKKELAKKDEYTLWSSLAPIWMYVVLTFMLLGVWANYIYTIVNLFRIKRDRDKYSY
jgi:hypothetical protein